MLAQKWPFPRVSLKSPPLPQDTLQPWFPEAKYFWKLHKTSMGSGPKHDLTPAQPSPTAHSCQSPQGLMLGAFSNLWMLMAHRIDSMWNLPHSTHVFFKDVRSERSWARSLPLGMPDRAPPVLSPQKLCASF